MGHRALAPHYICNKGIDHCHATIVPKVAMGFNELP